jgi:hypothetical protein
MTRLQLEAIACLLVATAVFAPYWPAAVLPFHDSIHQYQFFHFAYSHVREFGEIPLWVPYGSYGVAAALFQLANLTPASYLVGAVGVVIGAANTLQLFKLTVFLEVVLYGVGLLLFARAAYDHPLSRWLVVLGGLLSLSWLFQPHFNFLAFYLYPYILLFLIAYVRTGDPGRLWLAAGVLLASMIGTAPYFAPLHALVFTIMVVVAFLTGARAPLERNSRRWLLRWEAALAAALGATLLLMAGLSTEDIVTLTAGRNPDSGRVSLEAFLEYGRMTNATIAAGYLSGAATHGDNTYYIGLLPLVLVTVGLLRSRNPCFLGVAAAAVGLAWLSVGGYFATLAYYFPGMWLYRHIGLTFGLTSLLLLVASGWVLDELLGRNDAGPFPGQRLVVLGVLALISLDAAVSWREYDSELYPSLHTASLVLILVPLRVAAYAAACAVAWRRRGSQGHGGAGRVLAPLIAAYCLDIASFQAAVSFTLPRYEGALPPGSFAADPLPYRATRSDAPGQDAGAAWKKALSGPRGTLIGEDYDPSVLYSFSYTFLGVDPCYPRMRTDVLQRGVAAALVARGGRPRQSPGDDFLPPGDAAFRASLGCETSKIAVAQEVVGAGSAAHAGDLLRRVVDPYRTPIVESPVATGRTGPVPRDDGGVLVTAFTANRVELSVRNDRDAAWLYYADAFHPDWTARIGDRESRVVRANVGFKAVRIPSGSHEVVLTFGEGRRRYVSEWLALAGCLACLAGLIAAIGAALGRYPPAPR